MNGPELAQRATQTHDYAMLLFSTAPGYKLFADWTLRSGKPSLSHVVAMPDGPNDPMLTLCGREVPDTALLEAKPTERAHDWSECGLVCERCDCTMQYLTEADIAFCCVPTNCMLCRERL